MYHEDECGYCSQKEQAIQQARYWCKAVLQQLFSTSPIDLSDLERCLCELACYLEIPIPKEEINLKTTNQKKECHEMAEVNEWLKFNNQYLKQLTTRNI